MPSVRIKIPGVGNGLAPRPEVGIVVMHDFKTKVRLGYQHHPTSRAVYAVNEHLVLGLVLRCSQLGLTSGNLPLEVRLALDQYGREGVSIEFPLLYERGVNRYVN